MADRIKNSVWIVIPTWNRCQDLLACLASLEKVTYTLVTVLVIDNASTDGSADAVAKDFPQVEVIRLDENLGAPAASNIGFEHALANGADYILRLDSDTLVSPDFLTPLVSTAQANPKIGVVSPKIYFFDPPNVIWYAGVNAHPFHFGATNDLQNHPDSPTANRSRSVDYAWGAAMLIKRDVLEKLNGFDPHFFIYYEEVDFCIRLQRIGYQVYYLAESEIWHKVGTQTPNAWRAYQWNRSKMILFRKHARNSLHRIGLILYAYLYAIGSPIFKGYTSGNRGPLKAALRGLYDGLITNY